MFGLTGVMPDLGFEGRSGDLSDRIRRAVGLLCLAASRWWQAAAYVWSREPRIPPNKVRSRSFELGSPGQIPLCVAVLLLAVVLPWGKPKTVTVKMPSSSLNKVRFGGCAGEVVSAALSSSAGCRGDGGGGRWSGALLYAVWRGCCCFSQEFSSRGLAPARSGLPLLFLVERRPSSASS